VNRLNFIIQRQDVFLEIIIEFSNIKGKVIPLQAWTSPEGSRRLRLPDFKTIGI
jgi:hypothetical protein